MEQPRPARSGRLGDGRDDVQGAWNSAGQLDTNTARQPATDEYGDHHATQTATASLKVTTPAFTLTKTRVTDGAIQTSQTVTFDLTVTNSGDTTLTTVPLTDTWDAAYLLLSSSLPPVTLLARLRLMGRRARRTR